MGGAQPLAATMAGAAILCIEVDQRSIDRRLETRYLDEQAESLDDALARVRAAAAARIARSPSALRGNAADVLPELVARGEAFDLVTDQTAAHDPLTGYVPAEVPFEEAAALRERDPQEYLRLASESIVAHVRAMVEFVRMGCYVFDYGNNLRGEAYRAGLSDAFTYPGFVPAYIRPLFCRGIGPFRWAALSGDPADIADDRPRAAERSFPTTSSSSGGSSWRPSGWRSRGSRRASAGSATAIARRQGSRSMRSSARVRCRHRW